MKILFLGGIFDKEMEEEILKRSKNMVQYAANKLQWNLIDGLMNIDEVDLRILSAPFIGKYPTEYRKMFIKSHKHKYKHLVECEYVSFCNLWGFRNISRKNSLRKQIHDFFSLKSSNKAIIVYSPHTPFLQAAVYAKQKDPSIHICLIVPDIPQFMNLNEKKSIIYSKLKEVDIKIFMKNSKYIDSFVLLTKYMKDALKVGDRPYIVIEGVVNISQIPLNVSDSKKDKIQSVVYTGTLNGKFGVINLIKAFHAIKDEKIVLKISGRGDSEDYIKQYTKKDDRILFLGQLSNDEAIKLQKQATVLVNPRQNNEEFTRYSFPSKNMEYLLSGNPTIAYKLDGIPDEYDDYIFYVRNNSIESLRDKIVEVLSLSKQQRNEFGKKAREFVVRNKNNNEASLKLYNMIKSNLG